MKKVATTPAGQVVGQINGVESRRSVINRLLNEYADALVLFQPDIAMLKEYWNT